MTQWALLHPMGHSKRTLVAGTTGNQNVTITGSNAVFSDTSTTPTGVADSIWTNTSPGTFSTSISGTIIIGTHCYVHNSNPTLAYTFTLSVYNQTTTGTTTVVTGSVPASNYANFSNSIYFPVTAGTVYNFYMTSTDPLAELVLEGANAGTYVYFD